MILGSLRCEEDYYKILGVSRNSTTKQIKKAFIKLSKKYHPDIYDGDDAESKFSEISEAYEVLTDEDKRRKYDRFGKEGLKETGGRGGGFDPFSDFFGRGGQEDEEEEGESLQVNL